MALDFGMQFARNHRQQIDNICRELRESLQASNERGIDAGYASLQDALSELNHEVRSYYSEDEENNLFGSMFNIVVIKDESIER